ncbi:MAG: hypothetical protein B7Z80_06785 [Rhodospirillales bacterium 20-64-7]|nr:MAG: hypothetical protein B7Z80_06785 [Rhodospirillales bacterium 20-64-7]HQT78735.1 hypothetical protein [Rhodopila sp.]
MDLSATSQNLASFVGTSAGIAAQVYPHLSGLLGGAGYPTATPGLLQPALDPNSGWQLSQTMIAGNLSWTILLVWSRPNWRQGSNADSSPITLLSVGGTPLLQVDSAGGTNRLVLFPGAGQVVASTAMARRHTHSIILRYLPATGADMWLDQVQVAHSAQLGSVGFSGQPLLLHDGTLLGAAQCWLHEAAVWNTVLSDADVTSVLGYTTRWMRGPRRGIYLIINGQSNAINYVEADGAAAMLARGVAWYLGALACNVLATTTNATDFTLASGHGIYAIAGTGYPGSFVQDPGDGSNPSTWSLGADGLAVQQAILGLPTEDRLDMAAIIWPWNETDSLRSYAELGTFQAAALRYLSLLRGLLGDTTNRMPLVWWNAIPYGTNGGITMHRQAVQTIAATAGENVVIGNPQTSDSNPRGSAWDPATGIATGGDPAHRDSVDNLRFAVLAAPVVARSLLASGFSDLIATIPAALPKQGGPTISHVYRSSNTTLIVTVVHDGGTDLNVPLQAVSGAGFSVMDGGNPANPGTIIPASSCQKIDATHLQISLSTPLQNASSACLLFYPYGPQQIGRGNAVTDNFSSIGQIAGWQAGSELGSAWNVDYPLAATFSGIQLSDTPA